ncbi:MAG: 5-(carboxyamino)imidazole ribonucleotide synthase [Crocinitomicaceae bacterium]|nr:5-(carboxyamino)imidazole ribonucleotide synthase [Crocinitomicaceae bacterium]|tara:strand:- start:292 stop:1464 length:1173 start_codon:yes stop_codon:yes gene_type:complete
MLRKDLTSLNTGPTFRIGVLGGGQLGRMMIQTAIDLDMRVEVMDPSHEAPCRSLTHRFIQGDLNDSDAVYDFGKDLDVITIEIEHVSVEGLRRLEASGVNVIPKPNHIALIQDKGLQKQFFAKHKIPTADFTLIDEGGCLTGMGFPVVQKLRVGGYDGKGVQILKSESDIDQKGFSEASILEQAVDIDKELGVIVARNSAGATAIYPIVESIFDPNANLVSSLFAPAQIDDSLTQKAKDLALNVVEAMDFVGLMAVELFLSKTGDLFVNEIAPRTHNSGHHTIESNQTSQFAQHLRVVADLPLGNVTKLHEAAGMINLLGAADASGAPVYERLQEALDMSGVHPHLYGKSQVKPFRKMGHVTVTGSNHEEVHNKVLKLLEILSVTGTQEG